MCYNLFDVIFMKKYNVGDIVEGEVTGITNYGVFVKLNADFVGLIHISEISDKFVNNIERLYIMGDKIEAKIIEIDNDNKQLKLSIKQNERKNKRKNKLQEKGKGFKPLQDNLDKWIQEKLKDLEKMSKTP